MAEVELPKPRAPEQRRACRKLVRRRWGLASFPRKGQKQGWAEEKLDNVVSMKASANPTESSGLTWLFGTISVTSVPGCWLSLG